MPLVVGVDSSTQSTKVEARDLDTGAVVARGSAPHPPTEPPVSEQDPTAWWEALVTAMGQLGEHRSEICAIAVAGQQHGLVLLDELGQAVRPAKLWNDTTSAGAAAELVDKLGAPAWAGACGSVPVAAFTVSKLAWVARHEPEALEHARRVMLPHDYLTWRLTGRHVTDRGDASGTGWFDPAEDRYRPELLGTVVDDPEAWIERLPEVVGPESQAGELSPDAAEHLGLPPGIPVGPGTGDNMAAALGLGLRTGDLALSLGTSGTVYAVSPVGTADPSGLVAGFADAAGAFLPLVCTLNATKVTDTVAAWMGTDARGLERAGIAGRARFRRRGPRAVLRRRTDAQPSRRIGLDGGPSDHHDTRGAGPGRPRRRAVRPARGSRRAGRRRGRHLRTGPSHRRRRAVSCLSSALRRSARRPDRGPGRRGGGRGRCGIAGSRGQLG